MHKFFNFIHRHRLDIFFLFIIFSFLFFIFVYMPKEETKEFFSQLENKSFDIRQRIISKYKKVNKDIIIVSVDDPSYEYLIETYGDWPIPRNVYAELIDFIQLQKPKYVAFDLLFVKSLNRIPGSDDKLIELFSKYDNLYTAINFDDYSYELRKPPVFLHDFSTDISFVNSNVSFYKYTNCRTILPEIIENTRNIGHINTPKSDDGYIRMIPVAINFPLYSPSDYSFIKDKYYLYMTVKIAIDYLNKYENANIDIDKITVVNNKIYLGDRVIPLTKNGETILNWYGETGSNDNLSWSQENLKRSENSFKYISFWEVLKTAKAKENGTKELLPPDFFKDKFVYIGTNVFSLSDIKTVPTSKYLPGVEIHATLLNNILDNNLIEKSTLAYNISVIVLLIIAALFTVFKIRSVFLAILSYSVFIGAFLYFSTFVMLKYNLWISVVLPLFLSIVFFTISFIIKYMIKSRDFEYTYKLATTDGLTELYNHRFFQEQIKNRIDFCQKQNKEFSLILTDIDFFKKFNDKYGHQAGDAVLKHVSKTLKSCVRSEDFVCRYGGEEMAIILNNTSHKTALEIADKICKTVANKDYELSPDLEVKITISLGVATFPQHGSTPSELIEYSDKCLYKAKENGRNQVGIIC